MAYSQDSLKSEIQTSLHGRRLGLDSNDYLVGPKSLRKAIQDLTTVPTTVEAHGYARITATGSSQGPVQHFLPSPQPGQEVTLVNGTSSTGSHQFLSTANGAAIRGSSGGTTAGVINLRYAHAFAKLVGITTALWQVVCMSGVASTAVDPSVIFTTSTA